MAGVRGLTDERKDLAVEMITALSLERERLKAGLRDALHFYDRAAGTPGETRGESGYSAADVLRLAEIRKLASP